MVEQFCQIRYSLAEQFRQIKHSLAEQYRSILILSCSSSLWWDGVGWWLFGDNHTSPSFYCIEVGAGL